MDSPASNSEETDRRHETKVLSNGTTGSTEQEPQRETHGMYAGCADDSWGGFEATAPEGGPRQSQGSLEVRKQLRFKELTAARTSRVEDQKGER